MPPLPRTVATREDLDAEWGNQVVVYLGALNDKVDTMGRRLEAKIEGETEDLEAKIDGVKGELETRIDGVNDNIERLFQRVYPSVDFE